MTKCEICKHDLMTKSTACTGWEVWTTKGGRGAMVCAGACTATLQAQHVADDEYFEQIAQGKGQMGLDDLRLIAAGLCAYGERKRAEAAELMRYCEQRKAQA